jgi:hypothetical protein
MPQERLPMRKIRDALRLSASGLSKRKRATRIEELDFDQTARETGLQPALG